MLTAITLFILWACCCFEYLMWLHHFFKHTHGVWWILCYYYRCLFQ